jgi:hypothetical protein
VAATIVTVGLITMHPGASAQERSAIAARFGFRQLPANAAPAQAQTQRPVAPGLENIRQWISAVGAAVALTDLRGLGRPADMCLVDPRDDSVTVSAVPGSESGSYPGLRLEPTGLAYDATMAPMGCVPADVNEDGALDFLVYYWGRSPVIFLNKRVLSEPAQQAPPKSEDFTAAELVSPMQLWNTTAVNVADLDGSGHLSVIVGNYFPDGARVLDPAARHNPRMRMQDGMGLARNAGGGRILRLTPTGAPGAPPRVADLSSALPYDARHSWTLAIGLQDLTGTLLPSLYLANDFGPDQLLINCSTSGRLCLRQVKGARTWAQPKSEVLGRDSFKGMGVTFSYTHGTGLPTMLVSNITSEWALQESNLVFVPTGAQADVAAGALPYRERSEELGLARSGWSWDIKAGDFDNSGTDEFLQAEGFVRGSNGKWAQLQELAMGMPELLRFPQVWPTVRQGDDLSGRDQNRLYVKTSSQRYTDIAPELSLEQPGVSRGLALGDVNGDGKLDAVVANQYADSSVLLNTAPSAGAGADLRLVRRTAAGAEVPAIGATVTTTSAAGLPPQKFQLYYANGHAGVSAAEVHLALPAAGSMHAELAWRSADGVRTAGIQVSRGHSTVVLHDDGKVTLR